MTLIFCKIARDSKLWRSLTNGAISDKEDRGTQVHSFDHLRGVECNPCPLGHHNMEEASILGLTEPREKSPCLVCLFAYDFSPS
jgi:hypothetical protein